MKILFLCGSLESGQDGVGDYTRRLSGELIRQGQTVSIIALNEKKIKDFFLEEIQESEGTHISVLRLSERFSRNERFSKAKEWVNNFNPEWLSLQYVPFSFQKKGLSTGLAKRLKKIGNGRKWHVMFHELWVGMAKEDPVKLRLWGILQRMLIKNLIKTLRTNVIHAQTHLYQQKLEKLGFKVNYLPLFSNIPVKQIFVSVAHKPRGIITLVLFGIIHKNAPVEQLAQEVAMYSLQNNKKVHLILIGRNGHYQEQWITKWKAAGLTIEVLGEQSPDCISEILNNSTGGICTTAYAVVEKSGSFAALNAHGLPVLCVSPAWTPIGINNQYIPNGIVNYYPGNFKEFLRQKKQRGITNLENVVKRFIENLS